MRQTSRESRGTRPYFHSHLGPSQRDNGFFRGRWRMPWRALWQSILGLLLLHAMLAAQSTWEEKNQSGEKAFQEGQLSDASRLFSEALRDAQKFGANDVRLA